MLLTISKMPRWRRPIRRQRSAGFALIQAIFSVMVMGMLTSLSVDIGVYYTAKAELQRAADAACLAGVASLEKDDVAGAVQQAVSFAQANPVCGNKLTTSAIQAVTGNWEAGVFQPNVSPRNAIKVQVGCTAAGGNPIRLYFAQFIGLSSIDARATSISKVDTISDYKIVGIDHATFGSIGVLAQLQGRLVSNGNVSVGYPLGIGVGVQGEVHTWNGTVKKGWLASISGATDALQKKLVYPSVQLPAVYDNTNIACYLDGQGNFTALGMATIPAGTYVVRDLTMLATTAIKLIGPVTFYVTHNVNIAGTVTLFGSSGFNADNFKIRVLAGGTVNFVANLLTPLNLDLYAPDSDILVAVGVNAYKGRLIGKTLDILLPTLGSFAEDLTLGDPLPPEATLTLVR